MRAERRAVEIGVRDEARGAVRVVSREGTRPETSQEASPETRPETRPEAREETFEPSSDQMQVDANADEHAPPDASEASVEPARVDPALAGRELGPWTMVPAAVTVPAAIVLAALLAWYFARLGRAEVPRGRRRLRRASIACALVALVPLVRALTFVHPHEDRVGWAVSWSIVLFALAGWATLAVVDFVLVARSGLREYDALRRETFGAPRDGRGGGDGKEPRGG